MNFYSGLLFLQGHITNVDLARQLAGEETAPAAPSPSARRETACDAPGTSDEVRPSPTRPPNRCADA